MEKKESAQKFKTFLKKNVYYIIMAVCLLAIAGMITATVLLNNAQSVNQNVDEGLNEEPLPASSGEVSEKPKDDKPAEPIEDDKEKEKEGEKEEPTTAEPEPAQIVFAMPVETVDIARWTHGYGTAL